jgi:hypothetical protein
MKFALTLCLFLSLGFPPTAQVLPTSNGSCGIGATGLMSCEWLSAPPVTFKGNRPASAKMPPKGVFVTRYTLEPGAPLRPTVEGHDVLIVGMNDGEIANEAKEPQTYINVTNGTVMLMPKEEPYLLWNIGKQSLDLLLIDVRK